MSDPPRNEQAARDPSPRTDSPPQDLAAEAERVRTPRTPLLALTGVWLTVVAAIGLVLAIVGLALYFV